MKEKSGKISLWTPVFGKRNRKNRGCNRRLRDFKARFLARNRRMWYAEGARKTNRKENET